MKAALLTGITNEPVFLPLWLKYYSQHINPRDIFVRYHDIVDDTIEKCSDIPFNKIPMDDIWHDHRKGIRELTDPNMGRDKEAEFITGILKFYDALYVTHIDEFVVPDPEKYSGLIDFAEKAEGDVIFARGYDVVQHPNEPLIKWQQSILTQRQYYMWEQNYSKPVLIKKPVMFIAGQHDIENPDQYNRQYYQDLYLMHLHRIDKKIARDRKSSAYNLDALYTDIDKWELIPEKLKVF